MTAPDPSTCQCILKGCLALSLIVFLMQHQLYLLFLRDMNNCLLGLSLFNLGLLHLLNLLFLFALLHEFRYSFKALLSCLVLYSQSLLYFFSTDWPPTLKNRISIDFRQSLSILLYQFVLFLPSSLLVGFLLLEVNRNLLFYFACYYNRIFTSPFLCILSANIPCVFKDYLLRRFNLECSWFWLWRFVSFSLYCCRRSLWKAHRK